MDINGTQGDDSDKHGVVFVGWWLTYLSQKSWSSSVGIILPNIWKVIKAMFQKTNQFSRDGMMNTQQIATVKMKKPICMR